MTRSLSCACLLVVLIGCGAEYVSEQAGLRDGAGRSGLEVHSRSDMEVADQTAGPPGTVGNGRQGRGEGDTAAVERKIIYVATVSLVVEDFAETERQVPRLVREHGGYLADASASRTKGDYRSGRWVARVPAERYDSFLEALDTLGMPEDRKQTAQDVTEEFVDLEARIANKQRLEERIVKLLEDRSGKISDVIEIERELGRVREEIERMQGRLRYLANRAALTTVTIQAREVRDYVPPQVPTFAGRVSDVWQRSLAALQRFGEAVALTGVAAAPWLPVAIVLAGPPVWYLRRRRRPLR